MITFVFIAILAEKLPPEQRNAARRIGLILALLMRLGLLAAIAWVVTLTEPLFHIFDHPFSGRDLILLFAGVFLLFKGTMELHELNRRSPNTERRKSSTCYCFWMVIVQIVVLDAVFSLDSVITAVWHGEASKCHDAGNDYRCWYYALGIETIDGFRE